MALRNRSDDDYLVPARGGSSRSQTGGSHNVLGLWLTPMALATAYYLIPKVLGRPIYSYYLLFLDSGHWLSFTTGQVFTPHCGSNSVWLVSGVVASVMMVIPIIVVGLNHHMTVAGMHREVWGSPTLRFVVFGAVSYTLTSLFGSAMAVRSVNEVAHFTHFTVGHAHHGVYVLHRDHVWWRLLHASTPIEA